jgi:hypothetical protein
MWHLFITLQLGKAAAVQRLVGMIPSKYLNV